MLNNITLIKYHALGNDYLFLNSEYYPFPSNEFIKTICHRNFGIGSDGLLYGGYNDGRFQVTIINPDASIAEISGNGIRIFARAMLDCDHAHVNEKFDISTTFRTVQCEIISLDKISVDMGIPEFGGNNIPDFLPEGREVIINGKSYLYHPVSMGNPHCVIFVDNLNHEQILIDGPFLETNKEFCTKTNVQFAHVINRSNIEIEIWERGAGYTLASGSSSCAVFAVARRLNKCNSRVQIHMPGGNLVIEEKITGSIIQTGPVTKIAECLV